MANLWVLGRQGITAPRHDSSAAGLAMAVSAAGCIQAQQLPAARLALSLRLKDGLGKEHFEQSITPPSPLVRTWLMRGTMHLAAAWDWPVYVAAHAPMWIAWHRARMSGRGLAPHDQDREVAEHLEVFQALRRPLARAEIGAALSGMRGRQVTVSDWGGGLRMLCYQGLLVCGPPRGTKVTFVLAEEALGPGPAAALQATSATDAVHEVLARYLRAFGPATRADFGHWTGLPATDCGPAWARAEAGGRLRHVRLLDAPRLDHAILAEDADEFAAFIRAGRGTAGSAGAGGGAPSFLPRFDNFTLAYKAKDRLLNSEHRALVYRPAAEVAPVIVSGGRIVGVWWAVGSGQSRRVEWRLFPGGQNALLPAAVQRVAEGSRDLLLGLR